MRSHRSTTNIIQPESGPPPHHSNYPRRSPSPSSSSSCSSSAYAEECTIGDYHHKGGRKTFPLVLHEVLEEVEHTGKSHIISWQPHGRCFRIHDSKAFCEYIMPNKFRQSKWSSFQRQLNLYGFIRYTRSGPDRGGYYHEYFLRNRVKLSKKIQRTRVKGTKVRKASVVVDDEQPNFYAMPPLEGLGTGKNVAKGTDNFESKSLDHLSYVNECEMQSVSSATSYPEVTREHHYPSHHHYGPDYQQPSHHHQQQYEHYYGDRISSYSDYYHHSSTAGHPASSSHAPERPRIYPPETHHYHDRNPYKPTPPGPTSPLIRGRGPDTRTSPERTSMPRRVISDDQPSQSTSEKPNYDEDSRVQADLEPYNYKLPEEESSHRRQHSAKPKRPSWIAALDDWVLDFHSPDEQEETETKTRHKKEIPSSVTSASGTAHAGFTNRDISNVELNIPVAAKPEEHGGKISRNTSSEEISTKWKIFP